MCLYVPISLPRYIKIHIKIVLMCQLITKPCFFCLKQPIKTQITSSDHRSELFFKEIWRKNNYNMFFFLLLLFFFFFLRGGGGGGGGGGCRTSQGRTQNLPDFLRVCHYSYHFSEANKLLFFIKIFLHELAAILLLFCFFRELFSVKKINFIKILPFHLPCEPHRE